MNLILLSLVVLFGLFVFALTYFARRDDRGREEQMRQIQEIAKQGLEHWFEQENEPCYMPDTR